MLNACMEGKIENPFRNFRGWLLWLDRETVTVNQGPAPTINLWGQSKVC